MIAMHYHYILHYPKPDCDSKFYVRGIVVSQSLQTVTTFTCMHRMNPDACSAERALAKFPYTRSCNTYRHIQIFLLGGQLSTDLHIKWSKYTTNMNNALPHGVRFVYSWQWIETTYITILKIANHFFREHRFNHSLI